MKVRNAFKDDKRQGNKKINMLFKNVKDLHFFFNLKTGELFASFYVQKYVL